MTENLSQSSGGKTIIGRISSAICCRKERNMNDSDIGDRQRDTLIEQSELVSELRVRSNGLSWFFDQHETVRPSWLENHSQKTTKTTKLPTNLDLLEKQNAAQLRREIIQNEKLTKAKIISQKHSKLAGKAPSSTFVENDFSELKVHKSGRLKPLKGRRVHISPYSDTVNKLSVDKHVPAKKRCSRENSGGDTEQRKVNGTKPFVHRSDNMKLAPLSWPTVPIKPQALAPLQHKDSTVLKSTQKLRGGLLEKKRSFYTVGQAQNMPGGTDPLAPVHQARDKPTTPQRTKLGRKTAWL